MPASHYVHKCRRCHAVLSQCRCPSKDKTVYWVPSDTCPTCAAHDAKSEKSPSA